jgi:endogenous inhibitor of DNA gyrase (YacG/DUF329 family)
MPCPICKKPVEVGGPHFPFCSDRCKVIDLGRWLTGSYQIPVKDTDDDEEREGPGEAEGDVPRGGLGGRDDDSKPRAKR